jgi:hypothetical protein
MSDPKPRPMPRMIRADGIPDIPEQLMVSHPDFRDLWEICSGLMAMSHEDRLKLIGEVIDTESLVAFSAACSINEIAHLSEHQPNAEEATTLFTMTSVLMILVGIQYGLQHDWKFPEFSVPDHL